MTMKRTPPYFVQCALNKELTAFCRASMLLGYAVKIAAGENARGSLHRSTLRRLQHPKRFVDDLAKVG
jgi:hypothetical protein